MKTIIEKLKNWLFLKHKIEVELKINPNEIDSTFFSVNVKGKTPLGIDFERGPFCLIKLDSETFISKIHNYVIEICSQIDRKNYRDNDEFREIKLSSKGICLKG